MRYLEEEFKNKKPLFGIFNIYTKQWALDCFDEPRLFTDPQQALDYKNACIDYNNDNFKIEMWNYGVSNE